MTDDEQKEFLRKLFKKRRCVACDEEYEKNENGLSDHKCSPKFDAARKSADVRLRGESDRKKPVGERLSKGFEMLRDDYGWKEDEDGR